MKSNSNILQLSYLIVSYSHEVGYNLTPLRLKEIKYYLWRTYFRFEYNCKWFSSNTSIKDNFNLDLNWKYSAYGSLPIFLLYDKNGKLILSENFKSNLKDLEKEFKHEELIIIKDYLYKYIEDTPASSRYNELIKY